MASHFESSSVRLMGYWEEIWFCVVEYDGRKAIGCTVAIGGEYEEMWTRLEVGSLSVLNKVTRCRLSKRVSRQF